VIPGGALGAPNRAPLARGGVSIQLLAEPARVESPGRSMPIMESQSYHISLPLLSDARAEASRLGHSFVAPEHLLLAVAANADPSTQPFFRRHEMSIEALRSAVAELLGPERLQARADQPPAIAQRAIIALGRALSAGRGWLHPYSDRDLLLALVADGVAANAVVGAVLERFGLSAADARRELVSLAAEPQH
jgi:ATP-dependent Clp protease ATP-binding subunit ClpA